MLTYTQRRTLYGQLTVDSSATNLAFGDVLMNEEEKRIINTRAWDFTQRNHADVTVAGQANYKLPANYRKLIGQPTITVGTIKYTPTELPDRVAYDHVTSVDTSSDIPQYFYIFNNEILFYPKPSTAGSAINLPYEAQAKDLNTADYSTGTIVSITNGTTTVTGTGTTWTSAMAGRFIRITGDDSASSGDNEWYEIASVTSTTVLELVRPYEGTTIAAATQAYIIGQISVLPNGYHMLPVYRAAQQYYIQDKDNNKSEMYKQMYNDMMTTLNLDRSTKTSNLAIDEDIPFTNPNLHIQV